MPPGPCSGRPAAVVEDQPGLRRRPGEAAPAAAPPASGPDAAAGSAAIAAKKLDDVFGRSLCGVCHEIIPPAASERGQWEVRPVRVTPLLDAQGAVSITARMRPCRARTATRRRPRRPARTSSCRRSRPVELAIRASTRVPRCRRPASCATSTTARNSIRCCRRRRRPPRRACDDRSGHHCHVRRTCSKERQVPARGGRSCRLDRRWSAPRLDGWSVAQAHGRVAAALRPSEVPRRTDRNRLARTVERDRLLALRSPCCARRAVSPARRTRSLSREALSAGEVERIVRQAVAEARRALRRRRSRWSTGSATSWPCT